MKELCLDLFPLVYSSYASPSLLFWSDKIIKQGDTLGPLLLCLAIHSLVSQLSSEFCVWYLDDCTIGGSAEVVSDDLRLVIRKGVALGLSMNERKSELFTLIPSPASLLLPHVFHRLS